MDDVVESYKQSRIKMLVDTINKGGSDLILGMIPVMSWLSEDIKVSQVVAILTCCKSDKFVVLGTTEAIAKYVVSLCMTSNVNIVSLEVLSESCVIKHVYVDEGVGIKKQVQIITPLDTIKSDFIHIIKLDT